MRTHMNGNGTDTISHSRAAGTLQVFDPCGFVNSERRMLAARVTSLDGLRLSILDNTKWNAMALLRNTVTLLQEQIHFSDVRIYKKDAFSTPASFDLLQRVAAESDIAITAIGDCGSCTSCCTVDTIELECLGVPTALIITTEFVHESKMQALALGMTDLRPIIIDHPLSALTEDLIVHRARQAFHQAKNIWTGDTPTARP